MPSKTAPDRRVRRFDVASTATSARRLPNGWLRAEGIIARTGVQEYRRADGTVLRELRLPQEVFRAETLNALEMAPVTDEHPPAMLDASNTTAYQRGTLGEQIEVLDDRLVKAPILITDERLISKVLSGEQSELSVGYFCDLEHEPGVWNGQRYDCIQRNITPNHVAITRRARGGPELRVRLDAADAVSTVLHLDVVEAASINPKVTKDTMPNSLIDAAEAAVVAHFASQLAGRLDEAHVVTKMKAMCDEARQAVRLLLADAAPALKTDAAPVYRADVGASDSRAKMLERLEQAWKTPTAGAFSRE